MCPHDMETTYSAEGDYNTGPSLGPRPIAGARSSNYVRPIDISAFCFCGRICGLVIEGMIYRLMAICNFSRCTLDRSAL